MTLIERVTRRPAYTDRAIRARARWSPAVRFLMGLINRFRIVVDRRESIPDGAVIFACNHSNMHDIPTAMKVVGRHAYLLASDEVKNKLGGLMFWLNGVVWVSRTDKAQRARAKREAVALLQKGCSLLVFPEGTWNLSPAKPMLPMRWGAVSMAKAAGAPIVPLALEYAPGVCRALVGEALTVSPDASDATACEALRDSMATLRWEQYGCKARREITRRDYDAYVLDRVRELPVLTKEQIEAQVYPARLENAEAFAHLDAIAYKADAAFLWNKRLTGSCGNE